MALEAGAAYARSSLLVATDAGMDGFIGPGEVDHVGKTTANAWFGKARYDRFLTANNAA